jgi:PAS domain S-box-containing protein
MSMNPEDRDRGQGEAPDRQTNRRYWQVIEELPDGYTEFDLEGRLTYVNDSMVQMCSRTKDELMNLSYKAFLDQETVTKLQREYDGVCERGIPKKDYAYEIIRKDGQKRFHEGSTLLKKVHGKVVGFRSFWRDVTERKKNEQELANNQSSLETIFSSVQEGIIAIDAQGIVTNANQAFESICGGPVAGAVGQPFMDIQTQCNKCCHAILQGTLAHGTEIRERQIECRRHDRPQQVVVLNSSPLRDANGQPMGAVLVVRDITELLGLETELKGRSRFHDLIGKSQKMREIYELIETLANLETTVLITGESGTGKELVAKALHDVGERSRKPFVKVNCSALSESLLESELFGHVQGAFTGAEKDRLGRFEAADGGTLLLDEIGDISPLIQLKLLRVLQEKEFERVGESTSRKVDVRVISSTNKDLKDKVKNGNFREDLYYRLKVMDIAVPALRDRLEDLPLLVDHFCRMFRERFEKNIVGVASEVLIRFMTYRWPGNVRELEHAMEHAFVLCNGRTIRLGHLPKEMREYADAAPVQPRSDTGKPSLAARDVLNALERTGWNKSQAALLLNVDRRTIHRKIRQYHLRPK